MREFFAIFRDHLVAGLPPEPGAGRNNAHMRKMRNLRCTRYGAAALAASAPMEGGEVSVWPHPQLVRDGDVTLVGLADGIGVLEDGGVEPLAVLDGAMTDPEEDEPEEPVQFAVDAGEAWHLAAMNDLWFAANGKALVWRQPDGTVLGSNTPVATVASHDGRLLLGGVSGDWFSGTEWAEVMAAWRATQESREVVHEGLDFGENWVVWSERGGGANDLPYHAVLGALGCLGSYGYERLREMILTRIEDGEIGMRPCRGTGPVLKLLPLGDGCAVYGADGVSVVLDGDGARYLERRVHPEGVLSRDAVGGDDAAHVFVSRSGHLCLLEPGSAAATARYSAYFSDADGLMVNFDPVEREWWLATEDACHIWNGAALSGPHDLRPTGMARIEGALAVTAPPVTGAEFELVTARFDLGERGTKHVTQVSLDAAGVTAGTARVDWRLPSGHSEAPSGLRRGRAAPLNNRLVAFPRQSFVDAELVVSGNCAAGGDIRQIELRYQSEDRTYRRGTKGGTGGSEEAED